MSNALAMIECRSLPAAFEAADVMLKTSHVKLVGYEKTGDGYITVIIYGHTETIQNALEKGIQAAENVGEVTSLNVIQSPHSDLMRASGLDVTSHYAPKKEQGSK